MQLAGLNCDVAGPVTVCVCIVFMGSVRVSALYFVWLRSCSGMGHVAHGDVEDANATVVSD